MSSLAAQHLAEWHDSCVGDCTADVCLGIAACDIVCFLSPQEVHLDRANTQLQHAVSADCNTSMMLVLYFLALRFMMLTLQQTVAQTYAHAEHCAGHRQV